MVNLSAYKGKKVLLSGHTGFKGSWMLSILNYVGAEVMGYALEPETNPSLYTAIQGDTLCESVISDIRNQTKFEEVLLDFQPDFIFHLAAQPIVRTSYQIPIATFEVNAMGTAYVLEALRKLEKPCSAVMITTDKVYQNHENGQAYKESDSLGGYDPYSASKAAAELVINSYRSSFFNPDDYEKHKKSIASARAGNVIGGGDWAVDRLIPDIVRALSVDQTIQIRNPKAVRPWQHVLEPLIGYLTLGLKMAENPVKYAEAFNFGPSPDDVLTVEEMTKLAVAIWGKGSFEFPKLNEQPHEAHLLSLDIQKAKEKLDWTPKLNAKQALEFTLEWYQTFYEDSSKIKAITKQQIESYLNK